MPAVPFALVDVFGAGPLTGNPLAVVLEAEHLAEHLLPRVAREFNQSETTFVLPGTPGGPDRRLRSFTPAGVEVGGAGHNALGAWWWLAVRSELELAADGSTALVQEIGGQRLPLTVSCAGGVPVSVDMRHEPARIGAPQPGLRDRLAADLGIDAADLAGPPWVAFTGAEHLMVPVTDRAVLARLRPDSDRLCDTLAAAGGEGCYVFAHIPAGGGEAAAARFFNPTVGIAEDPGTGSAAGPLIASLVAAGTLPPLVPHVVLQAEDIDRPSRLTVVSDGSETTVSGAGVVVAEGVLRC